MKTPTAAFLIASLLLAATSDARAQGAPQLRGNNTIYLEGLGPGGLYSVNYERLVLHDLGVRVGMSYVSVSANSGSDSASVSLAMFPLTASYLGICSASQKHILELGAGATFAWASATSSTGDMFTSGSGFGAAGTAIVGYRYHPIQSGFNFRVGFSPLVGVGGFLPWGYIGAGGTF